MNTDVAEESFVGLHHRELTETCTPEHLKASGCCCLVPGTTGCALFCVGLPAGSDGKESACHAGDLGSVSGSGRSSGEGNGYPLQYSSLESSMDRREWQAL